MVNRGGDSAIFVNFVCMNSYDKPSWLANIPQVTRTIIIINIIVWLAEILLPNFGQIIINKFGLHFWGSNKFNLAQIFTYMFVHSDNTPLHVLFNMFTLYMFGRAMEQVWGSRRFMIYYVACGIGAAFMQEIVWQITWQKEYMESLATLNHVSVNEIESLLEEAKAVGDPEWVDSIAKWKNLLNCVGASGAVFGVLLGFAFVFPNIPMYLFFLPVPIKAKYMVGGYAVLEFFFGIAGNGSTVAHFAHLGGMLIGLILLLIWKKNGTLRGRMF